MADEPTSQPPQTPPPAAAGMSGRPGPASDTSKLLAALSYPIWIVGVIAIVMDPYKDEKFVKFHAIQGLALGIAGWVAVMVLNFVLAFIVCIGSIIGMLLMIGLLVYQIILAMKAYKGEYVEVPIIYGLIKSSVGEG